MSFMKAIKFGNYRNSSFFCAYITFYSNNSLPHLYTLKHTKTWTLPSKTHLGLYLRLLITRISDQNTCIKKKL